MQKFFIWFGGTSSGWCKFQYSFMNLLYEFLSRFLISLLSILKNLVSAILYESPKSTLVFLNGSETLNLFWFFLLFFTQDSSATDNRLTGFATSSHSQNYTQFYQQSQMLDLPTVIFESSLNSSVVVKFVVKLISDLNESLTSLLDNSLFYSTNT